MSNNSLYLIPDTLEALNIYYLNITSREFMGNLEDRLQIYELNKAPNKFDLF